MTTQPAWDARELERLGHVRIAEGHAMLAKAAALRADESSGGDEWLPVAASPLGKRRTLALAREGAIESAKVGRKVVIRASSLRAFLERHGRERPANDDEEDLFGAATRPARALGRRRGSRESPCEEARVRRAVAPRRCARRDDSG